MLKKDYFVKIKARLDNLAEPFITYRLLSAQALKDMNKGMMNVQYPFTWHIGKGLEVTWNSYDDFKKTLSYKDVDEKISHLIVEVFNFNEWRWPNEM